MYSTVTPQVIELVLAFWIIFGLASIPEASNPNRRSMMTWNPVLQATSRELFNLLSVTSFLKNIPSVPMRVGQEISWSKDSLRSSKNSSCERMFFSMKFCNSQEKNHFQLDRFLEFTSNLSGLQGKNRTQCGLGFSIGR